MGLVSGSLRLVLYTAVERYLPSCETVILVQALEDRWILDPLMAHKQLLARCMEKLGQLCYRLVCCGEAWTRELLRLERLLVTTVFTDEVMAGDILVRNLGQ